MGKKLRKRAKIQVKKEKARLFNQKLTKISKESLIPPEVAINSKIREKIESGEEQFILNFDDYSIKECQIDKIDRTQANSIIKKFQDITSTSIKDKKSLRIRDKIVNSGKYKFLFSGLSQDVELNEIEISGGGRIFFHFIRDYFCIVAIQSKHKNIH